MVWLFLIFNALLTFVYGPMYAAACAKIEAPRQDATAAVTLLVIFYLLAIGTAIAAAIM